MGRSAEKATPDDVRRYQVWLASIGTTAGTVNADASALRFFFRVTLKRPDLAEEVVSTREPRRLPVVLSPEEAAARRQQLRSAGSVRLVPDQAGRLDPAAPPSSRFRGTGVSNGNSTSAPPRQEFAFRFARHDEVALAILTDEPDRIPVC
jgi:hypothetical protein